MHAMAEQTNKEKYLNGNFLLQYFLRQFIKTISQTAEECRPATILDVGCGEGFVATAVAKRLPDASLRALDISPAAIEYARSHNTSKNLSYEVLDLFSLAKEPEHYDLVICNEVLEHLNDYDSALKLLCQKAKKTVIISVPNEPYFRLANFCRLRYMSRLGNHPEHVNCWSRKQITALAAQYGRVNAVKKLLFWTVVQFTPQA